MRERYERCRGGEHTVGDWRGEEEEKGEEEEEEKAV